MHIEPLLNIMRREALKVMGERGLVKLGRVSSYDPERYMVKVRIQPEDVESGWVPLASPWIGNGWGLFAPPQSGDLVDVHFVEGSRQVGYVSLRFFTDVERPQVNGAGCPAGEFWLVHESGQCLKLGNDGTVNIASGQGVNIQAPAVNLGAAGGNFQQLVTALFQDVFNAHTHTVEPSTMTAQPVLPAQQLTTAMLTTATKAN